MQSGLLYLGLHSAPFYTCFVLFRPFRNLFGCQHAGFLFPYPLYVYSGLYHLWYYFLDATLSSSRAVAKDANLWEQGVLPKALIAPVCSVSRRRCEPLAISLVTNAVDDALLQGSRPAGKSSCSLGRRAMLDTRNFGPGHTVFGVCRWPVAIWDRFLQFALYLGLFVFRQFIYRAGP